MGFESLNGEQRRIAAGEDEGLGSDSNRNAERIRAAARNVNRTCKTCRPSNRSRSRFSQLGFCNGMRRAGDQQCAGGWGNERDRKLHFMQAGERMSQPGRSRIEKTGHLLCCAGQRFEIGLGCAVADKDGFAGIDRCGEVRWLGNVDDVRADRGRKEIGERNLGWVANGILDVEDAVPNGSSGGRKGRGEQDGARGKSMVRGQNFGGQRAASRRVDFFEEKRIGVRSESFSGQRHDPRCAPRRERARICIEGLHRFGRRELDDAAEPHANGAAGAKKCCGSVASAGKVVGKQNDAAGLSVGERGGNEIRAGCGGRHACSTRLFFESIPLFFSFPKERMSCYQIAGDKKVIPIT